MEKRIYIPLPNFESRKELIKINLKTVEVKSFLYVQKNQNRMFRFSLFLNIKTEKKTQIALKYLNYSKLFVFVKFYQHGYCKIHVFGRVTTESTTMFCVYH